MFHDAEVTMQEWRRRVVDRWGAGSHVATLDVIEPCVADLVAHKVDPEDGLAEVGRQCGRDGHPLEDVVGWVSTLFDVLPRRQRRHLETSAGAVALTTGWADGRLERHASGTTPASTTELLRLRLQEHYDECASRHQDPASLYTLVVFDADTGALGPRTRSTAMAALAEGVRDIFHSGETISTTSTGRVLILADRRSDLGADVHRVVTWAESQQALAGFRVRGWVEPLSPFRHHIDDHLADLTR